MPVKTLLLRIQIQPFNPFFPPISHPRALMVLQMKNCKLSFWRQFLSELFEIPLLAWPSSVRCHCDKEKTIIQLENVLLRDWGGNSIKMLRFLPKDQPPFNQCLCVYTLLARVIYFLLILCRYFHQRITRTAVKGLMVVKNNLLLKQQIGKQTYRNFTVRSTRRPLWGETSVVNRIMFLYVLLYFSIFFKYNKLLANGEPYILKPFCCLVPLSIILL